MPRKPTLSPTKITTFLACPVKYRWSYVDARGKWYLRSKSYYSFGLTLHRVLQRFHDGGDLGVTTTEEVKAAYEENWMDAGFSSAEEMAEVYNEGLEILERHVEQAATRPAKGKTLFVERQFDLDFDRFRLIGRIDRVDEYPDGTLEIVDYKSGRAGVTPEDVAADIAMGCYQLLVRRKYPDRKVVATIFALRSGEEATALMTDEELDQFERDLVILGTLILDEDYFDAVPKLKSICAGCDFQPLCLKHPDYAEEFAAQG